MLVVSDGVDARIGSLTADWEWFKPWRTVDGVDLASQAMAQLEVLLKGVFDKRRFVNTWQQTADNEWGRTGPLCP